MNPSDETEVAAPPRTLVVVGDTLHVRDAHGRYCTHSALARQLDLWFAEFDRIVIAGVLDPVEEVPTGFAPYEPAAISFAPLRQAGGSGLRAKLGVCFAVFSWVRTLVPLLRSADVVHLRSPCNVTLLAIPLARVLAPRRYAIYAGAWDPPAGGERSYAVQRWMLRYFGGVVHVYAPRSAGLASNLRPNFSPTFTAERLDALAGSAARRLERIRTEPPAEKALRISCVGRFSTNKNQTALVQAVAVLARQQIPAEVRFAGAGGTEEEVRVLANRLGLDNHIHFLGRQSEDELLNLWEWSDVNATVTLVEGFGRVTLEAMALGCPTICGPGAMQGELVGVGTRGRQVDSSDPTELAAILAEVREQPYPAWRAMAEACRDYAHAHTIDAFGTEVRGVTSPRDTDEYERRRSNGGLLMSQMLREWRRSARANVARRQIQPLLERVFGWTLTGLGVGGATRPMEVNGEARFIAEWALSTEPRDVVCVDVGANEGLYTQELLIGLGSRATVHAFEPALETYQTLTARFQGDSAVQLHRVALCDTVGHRDLTSVEGRSQVASIYQPAGSDSFKVSVEQVPTSTLDVWAEEANCTHIDLLKIDVEGAEYDVLLGGRRLIAAGRVDVIQFEYGAQNLQSGASMRDIRDLLGPQFEIFRMVIDGLVPVLPASALLEVPVSATNYVARRRR